MPLQLLYTMSFFKCHYLEILSESSHPQLPRSRLIQLPRYSLNATGTGRVNPSVYSTMSPLIVPAARMLHMRWALLLWQHCHTAGVLD